MLKLHTCLFCVSLLHSVQYLIYIFMKSSLSKERHATIIKLSNYCTCCLIYHQICFFYDRYELFWRVNLDLLVKSHWQPWSSPTALSVHQQSVVWGALSLRSQLIRVQLKERTCLIHVHLKGVGLSLRKLFTCAYSDNNLIICCGLFSI